MMKGEPGHVFKGGCINLDTRLFSMIKENIYNYSFYFFWVWEGVFQVNHYLV